MGDIDSCYREVIMIVCQANQEQELLNALYVEKTLELSKNRMVGLTERLDCKSIVPKIAGLGGQLYTLIVGIVVNKSRQLKARTNNTVIWNVVIVGTNTRLVKMQVLGKEIKLRTQQYINGFIRTIRNLIYATIVNAKGIQNGQIYHRSITENEMTGLTYVNRATSTLTDTKKHLLGGISIRKRYAKFMNNNQLPENWEELTPQVKE